MEIDPEQLCNYLWDLRNFSETGILKRDTRATEILEYTSIILSIITVAVGLVGNTLVICIVGFKMKGVKAGVWVLNLAVADFIFLLCLPFAVISWYLGSWPFGVYSCKSFYFISTVNMYVSIFILTALTIDRCISVVIPLWHRKYASRRLSFHICLVLWIITVVLSIPVFLYGYLENSGNTSLCLVGSQQKNPFNTSNLFPVFSKRKSSQTLADLPDRMVSVGIIEHNVNRMGEKNDPVNSEEILLRQDCKKEEIQKLFEAKITSTEINNWNDMVSLTEFIIIPLLFVSYFIPLLIILSSNIIMSLHLKQSKCMNSAKSSKVYRIIVSMVAAYFLTWTPLTVVLIIYMVAARKMDLHLIYNLSIVNPLVVSVSCFNSCLNPILYVLVGQNVRREFRKSWYSIWQSLSKTSQSK
ncbi:chemokine-like receptor 1 [Rhinatrema bivittatum]|uniref:chemokine-like receptor 1 n=1 Tax=Rhinatrema bivittatum TaxID=194408 RepID=UPI00112EA2D5|nr:chemokine-like receptor 1 [Rhinatrema bivittatum]XP_029468822.1 chemokine-like receptor 1 [Rhinatrema bivittatum]